MCIFPETRRASDFVSITYNTNLDTALNVQEGEDVYLQLSARGTDGQFYKLAEDDQVTNTPELTMTPVEGKPGFYRFIVLPEEFFGALMPEGLGILTMVAFPTKAGFEYAPDTTPWDGLYYETNIPLLDCE
jgi:hypothetical protein